MRPEHSRWSKSSNRGVSDVVAFVLTFSIIITGVGVVSTGGFDRLTEFTADQQIDNSERGMEAAASTVDSLARSNDTYREFDLSLGGGNIWFNETAIAVESSDINLSPLAPTSNDSRAEIAVNALEHRFDSGTETVNIAQEGGAVFRTGTSRPRYEPAVSVEGETAIISLVRLTSDESIDRSGAYAGDVALQPTGVPQEAPVSADNQFISFRAELVSQQRVYETGLTDPDLAINISKAAYPQQWRYFFESSERGNWDRSGSTYELTADVDTVLVRVSTVELSILPRRTL